MTHQHRTTRRKSTAYRSSVAFILKKLAILPNGQGYVLFPTPALKEMNNEVGIKRLSNGTKDEVAY